MMQYPSRRYYWVTLQWEKHHLPDDLYMVFTMGMNQSLYPLDDDLVCCQHHSIGSSYTPFNHLFDVGVVL